MTDHERKLQGGPADEMVLRDWLAGQALAAFFRPVDITYTDEMRARIMATSARQCYEMADAMLAARKVPEASPLAGINPHRSGHGPPDLPHEQAESGRDLAD